MTKSKKDNEQEGRTKQTDRKESGKLPENDGTLTMPRMERWQPHNFPGGTIAYAKKKNDLYRTSYEVRLNNGFELEFDKNGCVTDFDDPDFDD